MSNLIDAIATTYDDTPYMSSAFFQSAPEHLRAVAHLFGLSAPAPEQARVLELGCAAGGNLIPFAVRHPQADVVGVDLSRVQVDAGRRVIERMGLANLRLIQQSISDIGAELGQFDYILCHGVYSWVPAEMRAAILRVCRERLSPEGVAYVSYNVYPGWKAKEIVRDAMLLRGSPRGTAQEKLAYARGMVEFMHEMAAEGSVLKRVMDDNIELIRSGDAHYLMHEFMELCNAPCYFREFSAAARDHGLAYLAESLVQVMFAANYGQQIAGPILRECGGQQEVLEQLLDFLNNRTFRQTLLVHADRSTQIRYRLDRPRIAQLHVAGQFDPLDSQEESWHAAAGGTVHTGTALERDVIRQLNAAWPATVPVAELGTGMVQNDSGDKDAQQFVIEFVERLVVRGLLRYRAEAVAPGRLDAGKPCVPAALRVLASASAEAPLPVTLFNAWHQTMPVPGPVESVLIPLADGSRSVEELTEALRVSAMSGRVHFIFNDERVEGEQKIAVAAADHARRVLQWLERSAMLEQTAPQAHSRQ